MRVALVIFEQQHIDGRMNGGGERLFLWKFPVMIYRLSRDIEFEQVFREDWVNYERNRLALDRCQSNVRSSGQITRGDVRRVQLGHGMSFFHLQAPVLRPRHLGGRLKQEGSAPIAQGGRLLTHTAFVNLHGKLVLTQEVFYRIRGHHVLSLQVKHRILIEGLCFYPPSLRSI